MVASINLCFRNNQTTPLEKGSLSDLYKNFEEVYRYCLICGVDKFPNGDWNIKKMTLKEGQNHITCEDEKCKSIWKSNERKIVGQIVLNKMSPVYR
jgi:hypothetical protein